MFAKLGTAMRRYLITGTLVLLPVMVTIYLLVSTFTLIDGILGRLVELVVGHRVPGAGTVLTILFTFAIGVIAANMVGRRLIDFVERLLTRIPIVRPIYLSVKQIIDAISLTQKSSFSRVVMIEYPRKGLYSIGFLTSEGLGEVQHRTDEHVVCVFVPTTPNPTSGWFVLVPRNEVVPLDMTVEDAFKLIISGGMLVPEWKGTTGDTQEPEKPTDPQPMTAAGVGSAARSAGNSTSATTRLVKTTGNS